MRLPQTLHARTSSAIYMKHTKTRLKPTCEFNFVVRQIMYQSSNSLQRRRHFCFDANPYPTGRRGLRRNRNVWRAASSDLSHWQLESKTPNKSPEPTAVTPLFL